MRNLIIAFILLIIPVCLPGQQPVTGYLRDAITKRPVEGANIQKDRKPVASSDKEGRFNLQSMGTPAFLKVTHIAYSPKEVLISNYPDDSLIIYLIPKTREIGEVEVSGKPYIQFFRSRSFYIRDFAIQGNRIWALGFEDKNILKPELRLLDLSGKTLEKIRVRQQSELFQDPSGTVHLYNSDSIFQLFFNGRQITFLYPNSLGESSETLFNLQVIRGDTVIYRTFNAYRTWCQFIAANIGTGKHDTIFASFSRSQYKSEQAALNYSPGQIPDCAIYLSPPGIGILGFPNKLRENNPGYAGMSDKDIMLAESNKILKRGDVNYGSGLTRDSRRAFSDYVYRRNIENKPVRSWMFYSHGLYYVFESNNLMIWRLKHDYSINDMLNIALNPEAHEFGMVQDPVDGSLYLTYQINGTCYVSRIDPVSGLISITKKIDGFPFPEKVQVYGGRIYFIHQSSTGQNFTNLYSIGLG